MEKREFKQPTKEQMDEIDKKIARDDKWRAERQQIGEERAGVPKGFIDRCESVVDYFSDEEATIEVFFDSLAEEQEHVMFDIVSGTRGCDPLYHEEYQDVECLTLEDWEDIFYESKWTPRTVGFAVGFALGSAIEVTDPEIQKNIEAIRETLAKRQVLPYLPRERRTTP
jgi:hypothetical protein